MTDPWFTIEAAKRVRDVVLPPDEVRRIRAAEYAAQRLAVMHDELRELEPRIRDVDLDSKDPEIEHEIAYVFNRAFALMADARRLKDDGIEAAGEVTERIRELLRADVETNN